MEDREKTKQEEKNKNKRQARIKKEIEDERRWNNEKTDMDQGK